MSEGQCNGDGGGGGKRFPPFYIKNLMADELAMEESTDILGVTSDSEYSDTNKDSAGLKSTPPDETEVLARLTLSHGNSLLAGCWWQVLSWLPWTPPATAGVLQPPLTLK